MLDPARPPFVTVLTLVRDAVSRLQHGEGSRSEIMSLLMDSKYLIKAGVNILPIKGWMGWGILKTTHEERLKERINKYIREKMVR